MRVSSSAETDRNDSYVPWRRIPQALVFARRTAAMLAPALLLAGCFGTKTPAGHAADYARSIAGTQGLMIESVHCSPRGAASWTCAGRLKSGSEFTCTVGPTGRVSPEGTCTVQTPRP